MRFTICWPLALLLAVSAQAGPATDRLDAFMTDVVSLDAQFSQTLFDENLVKIEDSAGRFSLSRPGKFRWDYTQPYPQVIVGDGENVWFYDSELSQVTVKSLDEAVGGSPAALLSQSASLDEGFRVREIGSQGGLEWVELAPTSEDVSFTTMRLGFGKTTLQMMEMVDNFGQITQLKFSAVKVNPQLGEALFQFQPPPGADVIGKPR